jgi:hypothetical protein
MAAAKTDTLIPLDKAAALLGIHPLHFNQVMHNIDGRQQGCGEVWLQYDWQKPSLISRESFAAAIAMAESDLEDYLGFPIAPRWYHAVIPVNGSPVVLPKAYFIESGIPQTFKIGEYPVTYEDKDDDGYEETAVIAIPPNYPPNEITIFYPGETDGWQIKPIKVANNTITLSRHQLVSKNKLEALSPERVLGIEPDNFLSSVDVYQITRDESVQAVCYGSCQCGSGCQTCRLSSITACMTPEDHKNSIVRLTPATWDADNLVWADNCCSYQPTRYAEVNFKAGWTGSDIWTEAVVYLALSRLASGLCQCPTVKDKLEWWSTDTAHSSRDGGSYKIPKFMEFCPWGYTRGAMYAFSLAWKYKMPQGQLGSI